MPRVDPADYLFTVRPNPKIGLKGGEFTLDDLKTMFKPHTVSCTLQCAGGRQEDFVLPDRPLYVEAKWREEAWGTARWRGTKVRDILQHLGLDVDKMALGEIQVYHLTLKHRTSIGYAPQSTLKIPPSKIP